MSRSVATASHSIATVYLALPEEYVNGDYDFKEFVEDARNVITEKYPSFKPCETWIGREVLQFLENQHAYVTISEYCGLVSICLCEQLSLYDDVPSNYGSGWCRKIADNFVKHLHRRYPDSALISQGHASNGEQFFRPVNRPSGMVTSKEGTLW